MRYLLVVALAVSIAAAAGDQPLRAAALAPANQTEEAGLSAMIIGSGSPGYNPERGEASVLVRYGNTRILVDMGNGTEARLFEANVPIASLDALLLTHQHLDHNAELLPIFIYKLPDRRRFLIAGPPPLSDIIDSALKNYDTDIRYRIGRIGLTLEQVRSDFTVRQLLGGDDFTVGGVRITTTRVPHSIYTIAYRFDAGGRSIAISGDLTYSDALSRLARGADYLIIDSGGAIKLDGSVGPPGTGKEGPRNGRAHVSLEETARMASDAGAKTIVLTHFVPGAIDESATTAELRKRYGGRIVFGHDLLKIGGDYER